MQFDEFQRATTPPTQLSRALQALWFDGQGDWETAHQYAQDIDDEIGSWVHAYLHRKEGDLPNARYWYRRAQRPVASGSLQEEWQAMVLELLG